MAKAPPIPSPVQDHTSGRGASVRRAHAAEQISQFVPDDQASGSGTDRGVFIVVTE